MQPSVVLLSLLLALPVLAQAQTFVGVASAPQRVTVFRQGALVTRTGEIALVAGTNDVRFAGLEQGVDAATVQVAIDPTVGVLTLLTFDEPGGRGVEPDSVVSLRARLDSLEVDTALLAAERSGYTEELELLVANREFPDELQVADYSEALRSAGDFYRERTRAIHAKLVRLDRRGEELAEALAVLRERIDAVRPEDRTDVGRVQARLLAERAGTFPFELSYLVGGAGWAPEYDLFVDPEQAAAPANLVLVAKVSQSTGVDWGGVDLTLSTGDPNRRLTAPELSVAYVGQPAFERFLDQSVEPEREEVVVTARTQDASATREASFVDPAAFASETSQLTTRSYTIDRSFDLPADGQAYAIRLSKYPLALDLRHRVVPKLEATAYLEGLATGWDTLNLVAGELRLHLAGRYLGTQYLNPLAETSDTITFALGADDAVVVERRTLKDVMDKQALRGRKSYDRAYAITVKNTRRQAIDILVEDQIPVPNLDEIDVDLKQLSGAKHESETGTLSWELDVPAGETSEVRVAYEMSVPKEVFVVRE